MISERTAPAPQETETQSEAPDQRDNSSPKSPESVTASAHTARICVDGKKARYKNIPDEWRALPPRRFERAIGHIEAVLLDISADGELTSNPFDWKPTVSTLRAWADHLRSALKELTR